jgi:diacylglycerol kinase family enzyme
MRDIGEISLSAEKGTKQKRLFMVGASLGIVAKANQAFNSRGAIVAAAGRVNMKLAVTLVFLRALAKLEPLRLTVSRGNSEEEIACTTYLAVAKSPYIGGGLRFVEDIAADNGMLLMKVFHHRNSLAALYSFACLARGKDVSARSRVWNVSEVAIRGESLFAVEADGEVFVTDELTIRIFNERIKECF